MTNLKVITSEKEYEEAMNYMKSLLNEAAKNGVLSQDGGIDNDLTREIGRIGSICAKYEDEKVEFKNITVRGRSPLVRVVQEEMYKRDICQKEVARLLGVNETVFSLFMNGKRGLSMTSAKKLYKKMNIDPKLILQYA